MESYIKTFNTSAIGRKQLYPKSKKSSWQYTTDDTE